MTDSASGKPERDNLAEPHWPSFGQGLDKQQSLARIAQRDGLVFGFASNMLITVAWWAITLTGFECMSQQRPLAIINTGLWIMAAVGLVLCFRLFMSVVETTNAMVGDPFSKPDALGSRVAVLVIASVFGITINALIAVTGNAIADASDSCFKLPDSMYQPEGWETM